LVYPSSNSPATIIATVFPHPLPHFHDHPCAALVCPTRSPSQTRLISCSFYCIILLTALFLSSCYWQPIPLTSSVSSSWAINTTFATVLTAALSTSPSTALPAVIRLADRCWCDVSSSHLFEPFDIARWEHASVEQLKEEVEGDAARVEQLTSNQGQKDSSNESNGHPPATNGRASAGELQPVVSQPPSPTTTLTSSPTPSSAAVPIDQRPPCQIPAVPQASNGPPATPSVDMPLIRRKYDLRMYGFSMILDFGWSRED
jgi:hypothetical protein